MTLTARRTAPTAADVDWWWAGRTTPGRPVSGVWLIPAVGRDGQAPPAVSRTVRGWTFDGQAGDSVRIPWSAGSRGSRAAISMVARRGAAEIWVNHRPGEPPLTVVRHHGRTPTTDRPWSIEVLVDEDTEGIVITLAAAAQVDVGLEVAPGPGGDAGLSDLVAEPAEDLRVQLLSLVARGRRPQQEVPDLGDASSSLTAVAEQLEAAGDEVLAASARFVQEAATLTDGDVPVCRELHRRWLAGDIDRIRDLVPYERADWLGLLRSAAPVRSDEQLAEDTGRLLEAVEVTFPGPSLSARIVRDPASPLRAPGLVDYLSGNPDIDLLTDAFHQDLPGVSAEATVALNQVQRLARVSARHDHVAALTTAGHTSAASIARRGRGAFVAQLAGELGDEQTAQQVFDRASLIASRAFAVYAAHSPTFNRVTPRVLTSRDAPAAEIPDWRTLFADRLDDVVEDPARSVLSPAAYLTDLLHFLEGIETGGVSALRVLLDRRPDLARLQLNQPNTDVPLPAIDLVNELLEATVLSGGGTEPAWVGSVPPLGATPSGSWTAGRDAGDVPWDGAADFHSAPGQPGYQRHGFVVPTAQGVAIAPGDRLCAWVRLHPDDPPSRVVVRWTLPGGDRVATWGPDPVDADPVDNGQGRLRVGERPAVGRWALLSVLAADLGADGDLLTGIGYGCVDGTADWGPSGPAAAAPPACTVGSAEGRMARPQQLLWPAYEPLIDSVFPWRSQPFDLGHATVTAVGEALGIDRSDLVAAFPTPTVLPAAIALACARLGITPPQRLVLLGEDGHDEAEHWGLDPTGDWLATLRQAPEFTARSGISASELSAPPGAAWCPGLALSEDRDAATGEVSLLVEGLTADSVAPLRRFLRLWRLLGTDSAELERFLMAATNGTRQLSDPVLVRLGVALTVARRLSLPLTAVAAWGSDRLDAGQLAAPETYPTAGPLSAAGSPWAQTFLRPGLGALTATFALRPDGDLLTSTTVDAAGPALCAALGISDLDLHTLLVNPLTGTGLDRAAPGAATLTRVAVSALHRAVTLSDALGLTVPDFLSLRGLSRLDPFDPADPDQLLGFVEQAAAVADQPWSLGELDYLLRHAVRPGSAPTSLPAGPVVSTIIGRRGSGEAGDDPGPDPTGDSLSRTLAGAPSVDVAAVLAVLGRSARFAVALPTDPGLPADPGSLTWDPSYHELVSGVLTTAKRDTVLAAVVDPAARAAVTTLYGRPRDTLAALPGFTPSVVSDFLDGAVPDEPLYAAALAVVVPALRHASAVEAVAEVVGSRLELDRDSTIGLLQGLPAGAGTSALDLLAGLDQTSDPATRALAEGMIERADKVRALAGSLSMSSGLLAFWLRRGPAAGWLDPAALPTAPVTEADLEGWLAVCRADRLRRGSPVLESLLLGVFERAQTTTDPQRDADLAQTLEDLGPFLGCSAETVGQLSDALDLHYPDDYVDEHAPARLQQAWRMCQVLRAEPARVRRWATEPASSEIGADMLAHARAGTSASLLQPVEDGLRIRRRDALQDFCSPQVPADQAMFARLLTDPETSVSSTTTRIAAATHAVQLFVQRALLDLEPAVSLTATMRQEWSWLSGYRSWSAARACFLHPENYLNPDARTDATAGFATLQNDLSHGDLTADSAERAFTSYLRTLDGVAQLEPAALYVQHDREDGRLVESTLHVTARTSATPHRYFHRTRSTNGPWSDWEPIGTEITSDLVSAYVLDRRLHMFWLESLERAEEPADLTEQKYTTPTRTEQYRLAWTVRDTDGWSAKRVSADSPPMVPPADPADLFLDTAWTVDASVLQLPLRIYDDAEVSGTNDRRTFTEPGHFSFDAAAQSARFVTAETSGVVATPSSVTTDGTVHPDHQAWRVTGGSLALPSGGGYADPVLTSAPDLRLTFASAPEWVLDGRRQSVDTHQPFFVEARGLPLLVTDQEDGSDARRYLFELGYHPYTKAFLRQLVRGGVPLLLARDSQLHPELLQSDRLPLSFAGLGATTVVDPASQVTEAVDFTFGGPYASYNWETFFHAPRLIAQRLVQTQRYEEARVWLESVFDPTDRSDNPSPQKYWQTKPLFATSGEQGVEELLAALDGNPDSDAERQVAQWRDDPFNPDLLARVRVSAHQKSTVMAYLDMLIGWADAKLVEPTSEGVAAAVQLFVLAAEILGPRPATGPRPGSRVGDPAPASYQELRHSLSSFSDAVVQLENRLAVWQTPVTGGPRPPISPAAVLNHALYFSVPVNQTLLGYWDLVEQRLADLRAGIGPQGQQLILPAYPSAGLAPRPGGAVDPAAALGDARPVYRFSTLHARAGELVNEVRGLGSALLSALEKRDSEALAVLHAGHELSVLTQARQVRETQLTEAMQQVQQLQAAQAVLRDKARYYRTRERLNDQERLQVTHLQSSALLQVVSQGLEALGSALGLVPEFNLGVSGFSASPVVTGAFGGRELSTIAAIAARLVSMQAGVESHLANMASLSAGWQRRWDDWQFQLGQANLEIQQLERQIAGATTRQQQARQELQGHDLQLANSAEVGSFLQRKFTNQALYDWLAGQLTTVYGQAYRLAVQAAQRAERAFQFELADGSSFVKPSYWDSLRGGLGAADQLSFDLHRMEAAYLERNARPYEITKTVSLALIAPEALLRLRTTGQCDVELTESLYDLDYPGHYLRRLRRVGVTVPCVTGPYAGVNCTLSLVGDSTRVDPGLRDGRYLRQGLTDDRFVDRYGLSAGIVTSGGLDQTGAFDPAKDDRYEPYEGAGAISRWRISLPQDTNSFVPDSLTDLVLTVQYTARDGGSATQQAARNEVVAPLRRRGVRLLSARSDFPDAFMRYQSDPGAGARSLTLPLTERLLPATADPDSHIVEVTLLVLSTGQPSSVTVGVTPPQGGVLSVPLAAEPRLGGALTGIVPMTGPQPLGALTVTVAEPAELPLVDLFLLLTYAP